MLEEVGLALEHFIASDGEIAGFFQISALERSEISNFSPTLADIFLLL
jgi:hypothetical protein